MRIRTGDNVIVIAGKDKGKTGKVEKALPREGLVVVEGVNVVKRHQRPRRSGQKGQIVERAMPIDASNVQLVDPKGGKRTRVGYKEKDLSADKAGGKRVRFAKGSGTELSS